MNLAVIIGRLGKDVDITYSKDGKAIGKFSVGVTRASDRKITDWFNCVAFGKTAEVIAQYFTKGSEIALNGEIQFGQYTNNEGVKVYTTTYVVNKFNFTGGSKANDGAGGPANNTNEDLGTPIDDGDMPF